MIVCANTLLDCVLQLGCNLDKGEAAVWRDIYDGNLSHDTWVIGSSTSWVQVLTKENSYNLGIDGYKARHQILRLNEALRFNSKPARVIWLLDPWTFEEQQFGYNKYQSSSFRQLDSLRGITEWEALLARYRGCMREFTPIIIREGIKLDYRFNGARCVDIIAGSLDRLGNQELQFNESLFREFMEVINRLEAIGVDCDIIYVEPHDVVRDFYTNMDSIMENILTEPNIEIHLIPNSEFLDTDYYNAMHLNCSGAEKLTRLLMQ